jgi:GH25 family lysozyme M1 (1,4-beta-N-acetylmuramidase)
MRQYTKRRLLRVASGAALAAAIFASTAAPASAAPRTLGIDVSRFNGVIDWAQVAGSGVRFAFVQASRGSGIDCTVKPLDCGADPLWAANAPAARAAGVRIGAYHRAFATGATRAEAKADAGAEAAVFVAQVGRVPRGDLLPVLDVESPFTGLTPGRLRAWIQTWMKRVHKGVGVKPIIYTNATSWAATGNTTKFAAGHPLWVAQWQVAKPTLVPAANWGGRGWTVWQFTSSGSVPGISGRVDLDYLRAGLGKILVR